MTGKVLMPVTTNGSSVIFDLADWLSLTLAVFGTFGASTAVFEVSFNSTNGTDGTWLPCTGTRSSSGSTQESGFTGLVNTPAYYWVFSPGAANYFRVRFTALASGTVNVAIIPSKGAVQFLQAQGAANAAHDAVASAAPTRVAGKSAISMPAMVSAAGDVVDLTATMQGALVISPHTTPNGRVRGSAALTTTSDVAVLSAGGGGISNNLVDLVAINTGAAVVELILKDGTTEFWRLPLPVNVPVVISLDAPIRGGANLPINAALSAAGTVRCLMTGFTSV